MHMRGASIVGPAERDPLRGTRERGGVLSRDDETRLFLQTEDLPKHVAAENPRRARIEPRRLTLLSKLAVKMAEPSSGVDTDNPEIPAGFTYLAQFAAHDLSFNLTPFDEAKGPAKARTNARHARLVLETLYGLGPTVHPHLYHSSELGSNDRGTLRLGQLRSRNAAAPASDDPWLDLPRVRAASTGICPYRLDGSVQRSPLADGRHETLTADSRNDDNVMISQITVLFSVLHNTVYHRLDEPSIKAKLPPHLQDPRLRFSVARDAVTLAYRRIVFNDFLRRLLDPAVYRFFVQNGALEPDPEGERGMPLEFSHAAFRIGHSMVRSFYEMNDGIDRDARSLLTLADSLALGLPHRAYDMPLLQDWYAQWSKFFETNGRLPQPSRRIGPSLVPLLGRTHQFPNHDGPDGRELAGGLIYRDLVRGEAEGLMTPLALAYRLLPIMPNGFDPEAYAEDVHNKLVGWLCDAGLSPGEVRELAGSPPLTLFVLLEAWAGPAKGCRLGPIGSLIVGEVFFRAQSAAVEDYERNHHLQAAASVAFDGAVPDTMTALLETLAAWAPLEYRQLPLV
ncbi:MAG TPA: peroxidase family protein [Alphaproteobacteria bacterium]|nr:peroxidase family protein [Alphaproteobacteria bacterium]